MNAITQRNILDSQLKSYINFMLDCPRDSFSKLSNEMIKIINRLDQIKCMGLKDLMKEVPCYYETKQSKMNYKTL